MTPKNSVLNKYWVLFKMETLSIASLLSFFSEEKKSIQKGGNHYRSNHVEALVISRAFYVEKYTQV